MSVIEQVPPWMKAGPPIFEGPKIVRVLLGAVGGTQGPPGPPGQGLESRAVALTTSFPASQNVTTVHGYYAFGDSPTIDYRRVGTEPAHALKFQSLDGAWWEGIPSLTIDYRHFGAIAGDRNLMFSPATQSINRTAIQNAANWSSIFRNRVLGPPGLYHCDGNIDLPANTFMIWDDDFILRRSFCQDVSPFDTSWGLITSNANRIKIRGGHIDNGPGPAELMDQGAGVYARSDGTYLYAWGKRGGGLPIFNINDLVVISGVQGEEWYRDVSRETLILRVELITPAAANVDEFKLLPVVGQPPPASSTGLSTVTQRRPDIAPPIIAAANAGDIIDIKGSNVLLEDIDVRGAGPKTRCFGGEGDFVTWRRCRGIVPMINGGASFRFTGGKYFRSYDGFGICGDAVHQFAPANSNKNFFDCFYINPAGYSHGGGFCLAGIGAELNCELDQCGFINARGGGAGNPVRLKNRTTTILRLREILTGVYATSDGTNITVRVPKGRKGQSYYSRPFLGDGVTPVKLLLAGFTDAAYNGTFTWASMTQHGNYDEVKLKAPGTIPPAAPGASGQPAAFGAEMLLHGTDFAANWTFGTGWSLADIGGGVMKPRRSVVGSTTVLEQTVAGIVPGATYQIEIEVLDIIGELAVRIVGSSGSQTSGGITSPGIIQRTMVAPAAPTGFQIRGLAGFSGTIGYVSLKQLTVVAAFATIQADPTVKHMRHITFDGEIDGTLQTAHVNNSRQKSYVGIQIEDVFSAYIGAKVHEPNGHSLLCYRSQNITLGDPCDFDGPQRSVDVCPTVRFTDSAADLDGDEDDVGDEFGVTNSNSFSLGRGEFRGGIHAQPIIEAKACVRSTIEAVNLIDIPPAQPGIRMTDCQNGIISGCHFRPVGTDATATAVTLAGASADHIITANNMARLLGTPAAKIQYGSDTTSIAKNNLGAPDHP